MDTSTPNSPGRLGRPRFQLAKTIALADGVQGSVRAEVTPERGPLLTGGYQFQSLAEQLHGPILVLRAERQTLAVARSRVRVQLADRLGEGARRVPQHARRPRPPAEGLQRIRD